MSSGTGRSARWGVKTGDILGFSEAGPGTPVDTEARVGDLHADGRVELYFEETGMLYAPGVIQAGLEDGSIVVVSQD